MKSIQDSVIHAIVIHDSIHKCDVLLKHYLLDPITVIFPASRGRSRMTSSNAALSLACDLSSAQVSFARGYREI